MRDAAVGIGLLGARSWVANRAVIPAIAASQRCELVAVGSAGGPVPDSLAQLDAGGYDAVLAHPDVEAVYIALSNGLHRTWVERAAQAGKHVLCEKPLGVHVADTAAMISACDDAGVVLAEAWMTPFGGRWQQVMAAVAKGQLGDIRHVRADFTFVISPDQQTNYRWDPAQGGGALLDVGIYALGAAVQLWGPQPDVVRVSRHLGPSGIDTTTSAWCDWGSGRTASVLVSFALPECQRLELVGTAGRIVVGGPAFTGGELATEYRQAGPDGQDVLMDVAPDDPYRHMVDAFASAVRGVQPWPRAATEVLAMAQFIERLGRAGP